MTGRAALAALLVVLPAGSAPGCRSAEAPQPLLVFAAASMADGAEAFAADYEAAHPGVRVTVSPGASSTLARQIAAGAPADVFLSASPAWTTYLQARDAVAGEPVVLAYNRLVVVGPPDAAPWAGLGPITAVGRLAVADPTHVPAGRYAREALDAVWDRIAPRVIPTLDVRAALAAAQSGAADAAVVYASDTLVAPDLTVLYTLPDSSHARIALVGVVTRTARAEATGWLSALAAPEADSRWRAFGFMPASGGTP